MANEEHLELLKRDIDAWNKWMETNPRIKPDLSRADLGGADLMLANLAGADLKGANLILANLKGADLRRADLSGANLVGARLLGLDLVHADLSGADLRTAEDLTQEQISQTRGDKKTRLPLGSSGRRAGSRKAGRSPPLRPGTGQARPRSGQALADLAAELSNLSASRTWPTSCFRTIRGWFPRGG